MGSLFSLTFSFSFFVFFCFWFKKKKRVFWFIGIQTKRYLYFPDEIVDTTSACFVCCWASVRYLWCRKGNISHVSFCSELQHAPSFKPPNLHPLPGLPQDPPPPPNSPPHLFSFLFIHMQILIYSPILHFKHAVHELCFLGGVFGGWGGGGGGLQQVAVKMGSYRQCHWDGVLKLSIKMHRICTLWTTFQH